MSLPIDPLLPQIVSSLRSSNRLVLHAEPGAGKTTRVPAACLDAGLASDKQIVVLEPRRIAARAAAEFVASQRRGTIGEEIGYRVRYEQKGGRHTRLWFVTEGMLVRQLARDPFLEEIGLIVLDEFHERHIQGDLALGVVCELQETVRPDLKLIVMSATLESERVTAFLGGCPSLASPGRSFPVDIEYLGDHRRPLAERIAAAVGDRLRVADDRGDILVFLPGAGEIRRAAEKLVGVAATHDLELVPLHGDLPLEAQHRALHRGRRRKVVLATNVAETALTIEGVTTVIDSGLVREARLDRSHGINGLHLGRISRASAKQRAGRAGRTAPGRCLRLWSEADHAGRRAHESPEILRLDLSATLLQLRAWGSGDARRFRWLDAPSESSLAAAEKLLTLLGAIDAAGSLTETGKRMLDLGVEPRLARVLVEAERLGCGGRGALIAALASERDILLEQRAFSGIATNRWGSGSSDLLLRLELFEESQRARFDASVCSRLDLDRRSLKAVERARRALAQAIGGKESEFVEGDLLRCVLAGFPDRVVRRREAGSRRGVMSGGRGVVLHEASVVRDAELFVAVDLDSGPRRQHAEAVVRLASAVDPRWLEAMFPSRLRREEALVFDEARERVVQRVRSYFEDLVLQERIELAVDRLAAGEILAEVARQRPREAAQVGENVEALLRRIEFLGGSLPELDWPVDREGLLADAVGSLCGGCLSFAELHRLDVYGAVRAQLTGEQWRLLENEAPSHITLPTGRQASIDYEVGRPPHLAVRIQEVFGLAATPRLAKGRVALVFELLSPSRRPVQVTDDLGSFWRNTYQEVRKVLRGRYPKHPWPEDPLHAEPTARAKPRK